MLDNVKAVENDFSVWKSFFSNIVVWSKLVHCNDFHTTSNLSGIMKEMIANSHLSPPIQDSYDLSGIKILCNEAHFTFLEAVFIPRHVSWKER